MKNENKIESIYKKHKKELILKPILWGSLAGIILFAAYILILTLSNSFAHAIEQFEYLWYWMVPLIVGFSIQVGLFIYVKKYAKIRAETTLAGSSIATAGGISATSMVACCLHHVTDILPILGISAATMFLAQYQNLFLIIGILSNLIGINIMLNIIQKHQLYVKESILKYLFKINMKKLLYVNISFSVIILILVFITTV